MFIVINHLQHFIDANTTFTENITIAIFRPVATVKIEVQQH